MPWLWCFWTNIVAWALQKMVPLCLSVQPLCIVMILCQQQSWFTIWCWVLTATIACQKLGCDMLVPSRCFAYQFAATAETAAIIRCGLRGSVDIKALSTLKATATAHQHGATRQGCRHTSTSYGKRGEHIQAMIKHRCESSWQCMRRQFVSPHHLPSWRNTH